MSLLYNVLVWAKLIKSYHKLEVLEADLKTD